MDFKNSFFCIFIISNAALSYCTDSPITKIAHKKYMQLKQKPYGDIKKNISINILTTDSSLITMPEGDDSFIMTTPYGENISLDSSTMEYFETTKDTNAIVNIKTTTSPPRDISCTCGIFLGSQFIHGSSQPPKGDPVISITLPRSFVCNSFGQKQCQTKCLERIVQHLPSSANILCASAGRDIHSEKAFLFVRNCNNKWLNTNLAAGRKYCCKNGLPYNCPRK